MAGFRKKAYKVEQKIFGKGGIKTRYGIGKGRGGLKITQIAKDLEMVKSRLNVEKKEIRSDVTTDQFGQVNGNSDGALVLDMTQAINQGIGETQRIGNSLKCTGMSIPIQLTGQAYTMSGRKVRITMLKVRSADNDVTGTEAFQKVWETNPLSTVRDYNAPRAYRNSKTDGISIVRTMTTYLAPPQLANGGAVDANEASQRCVTMNLKLNDIWRYGTNADTVPSGLKYYLVFQSDVGNISTTGGTTLDVPVTGNQTALDVRVYQRTWFVDN